MSQPRATAILMYHAVGLPINKRSDRFLNVSVNAFRRQMRILGALGYSPRTLSEVIESRRAGLSLPRRTFAVTFDDGYRCIGENAGPILREETISPTVFVVSDWAATEEIVGLECGRIAAPTLTWEALRGLAAAGWEIGGHTITHAHLDGMEDEEAGREIAGGKVEIERQLAIEVRTFCYPFGHYSGRTAGLVKSAGYVGACTVRSGLATDRSDNYALPRIKVSFSDGVAGLLYRLLVRPRMPTLRRGRRSHVAPVKLP